MRFFAILSCLLLGFSGPRAAASSEIGSRDHLRDKRYGEILLITGGPLSFTGHVYNTIGLNDCPEKKWKTLNPEKLAEEFEVRSVILNGPRYFLMDKNSLVRPGEVVSFQGLKARHLAAVRVPFRNVMKGKSTPYRENEVRRTTEYVFRAGRPLYELVSPKGQVYVMQSYSQQVDPQLTMQGLKDLGTRLKLPKGWTYRTRVPEKDFILRADGVAYVLQDELQNSYQRVN